jgi:hypothetical protein
MCDAQRPWVGTDHADHAADDDRHAPKVGLALGPAGVQRSRGPVRAVANQDLSQFDAPACHTPKHSHGVSLGSSRVGLQIPRRPLEDLLMVPGEELRRRLMVGVRRRPDGLPVVRQQQLAEPSAAVELLR